MRKQDSMNMRHSSKCIPMIDSNILSAIIKSYPDYPKEYKSNTFYNILEHGFNFKDYYDSTNYTMGIDL